MGAVEEGGKVAGKVVEGLKHDPMILALVVINILFLVGGGWVIHDIAERVHIGNERRDKLLGEIIKDCRKASDARREGIEPASGERREDVDRRSPHATYCN